MAVQEQIQNTSPSHLAPDPNVIIPEHVRRASEAADALHKQAYPGPVVEQPAAPVEQPAAPVEQPIQPVAQPAAPVEQPVAPRETQPIQPGEEHITSEEWRHRFLSMQGRFNAAQRERGSMEQQMQQLGQELVRTQELVAQLQATQTPQQNPMGSLNHGNLITDEDRANYGDELIDLSRRAAREAITPELEQLRADNQRLNQRVKNTGKRELFATLDGAVPNWRAINHDQRFISWLRLPNVYTGQVRGKMLNAAVDGADAPKAIALFRDFLAEAAATGQSAPTAQVEQQVAQQPAPRTPALELETLAAPGRGRPASGDSQMPVEKPTYTRAQISHNYDQHRRGVWAGREADWHSLEVDMVAASGEGRVRG